MALLKLSSLLLLFLVASASLVKAQVEDTSFTTLEWPTSPTNSMYPTYPTYPFGGEVDGEDTTTMIKGEVEEDDEDDSGIIDENNISTKNTRRSLFWHRMRFYISYGALSANRIPCPPRSGRSYYTHNCYRARGPAHPYTRGCNAITRCRR